MVRGTCRLENDQTELKHGGNGKYTLFGEAAYKTEHGEGSKGMRSVVLERGGRRQRAHAQISSGPASGSKT